MPRDQIKRYIVGPEVTKVVVVLMILEASSTVRQTETTRQQSDRGKDGRDEDRGRERDRYNEGDRNRDRQSGRQSDREYTLTQRPNKPFNHISEPGERQIQRGRNTDNVAETATESTR